MAHIVFYQKPGCINNTKQLKLLRAAGHQVRTENLLTHHWTAQSLQPFLNSQPDMTQWFNPAAPDIKRGVITPSELTQTEAIRALIAQPLLIKRPLMVIDDTHFIQGFNPMSLMQLINLKSIDNIHDDEEDTMITDLSLCPNQTDTPCR